MLLFYVLCGAPLCGVLFLLAYFAVFFRAFRREGSCPFLVVEWLREVARADMESAPTVNHKFCNSARCFGGVKTPPCGTNLQRDVGANSVRPGSWAFTQGCTGRRGRRPLRVTQKFESARGGPPGSPKKQSILTTSVYCDRLSIKQVYHNRPKEHRHESFSRSRIPFCLPGMGA